LYTIMVFSDDYTESSASSSSEESDESEPNTEDLDFIDDESVSDSSGSESDVEISPEEMVVGDDDIELILENVVMLRQEAEGGEGEETEYDMREAVKCPGEEENDADVEEEEGGEEQSEDDEYEQEDESGDDGHDEYEEGDVEILRISSPSPVVIKIEDDDVPVPSPPPKKRRGTRGQAWPVDAQFQAALLAIIKRAI
jgi:hypothetical protein